MNFLKLQEIVGIWLSDHSFFLFSFALALSLIAYYKVGSTEGLLLRGLVVEDQF